MDYFQGALEEDAEDSVRLVEGLDAVLVPEALVEEEELVESAHLMVQLQRFGLNLVSVVALMDQVLQGARKSLQRLARHRSSHLLLEPFLLPSSPQFSSLPSLARYRQLEWHWDRDRAFGAQQVAQGSTKQT